jgi:hypothetical protein
MSSTSIRRITTASLHRPPKRIVSPCLPCPLQWFEDLGGFEKAENIQHFVAWSIKAVELFGSRITYWATFNEPTVRRSSSNAGAASRAAAAAAAEQQSCILCLSELDVERWYAQHLQKQQLTVQQQAGLKQQTGCVSASDMGHSSVISSSALQ